MHCYFHFIAIGINFCHLVITNDDVLPTEKQVGKFGGLAGEPSSSFHQPFPRNFDLSDPIERRTLSKSILQSCFSSK